MRSQELSQDQRDYKGTVSGSLKLGSCDQSWTFGIHGWQASSLHFVGGGRDSSLHFVGGGGIAHCTSWGGIAHCTSWGLGVG